MKFNKIKGTGIAFIMVLAFNSCSSGGGGMSDPIVEEDATVSGKITVSDLNLWPDGDHELVFRAYKGSGRSDLAFEKQLVKSSSGVINFRVEDVPLAALSNMEIAIVNINDANDFDTRMYYGSFTVNASDQIRLPDMEFSLEGEAPEFLLTKIEDKIFAPKCFQCHNSQNADRDLDLSKWQTYGHSVNVKSKIETDKFLVKPGDLASSFFYSILEKPELAPDMIPVQMTDDEMALIKRWINEGAIKQ